MSRAALVDAAFDAQVEVQIPPLSSEQAHAVIQAGLSDARKALVNNALLRNIQRQRSLKEKHDGDCFFSALEMASDNLTGRHYTIAELRDVLANIILTNDLVDGWEQYRLSEVTDIEARAKADMEAQVRSGEFTKAQATQAMNDTLERAQQLRNMSRQEYAQYVKTREHWANDFTLHIFSAYFDVQLVPLRQPVPGTPVQFVPLPLRGSKADAYIFLWYSYTNAHYDLFLDPRGATPAEQVTVYTSDTLPLPFYDQVKNSVNQHAVTPVLLSKLPVLE